MKIEKKENGASISHNGLTIFIERKNYSNPKGIFYVLKTTESNTILNREDYKELLKILEQFNY